MENKICPLLSAASDYDFITCKGDRCAWYVPPRYPGMDEGRCAVQALPDLAAGVRRL